jgi:hypothetical protein
MSPSVYRASTLPAPEPACRWPARPLGRWGPGGKRLGPALYLQATRCWVPETASAWSRSQAKPGYTRGGAVDFRSMMRGAGLWTRRSAGTSRP